MELGVYDGLNHI